MRLALLCSAACTSRLKRMIPSLFFAYVRYRTDSALPNFYKRNQGNSDRASIALALLSLQRHAASTEDTSITQPDAIPAEQATHFAHQALKALGFVNLGSLFKRSHAQPPLSRQACPALRSKSALTCQGPAIFRFR